MGWLVLRVSRVAMVVPKPTDTLYVDCVSTSSATTHHTVYMRDDLRRDASDTGGQSG